LGDNIKITILVGDNQGECDANCGVDWSLPESVTLAAGRIKERFGEDFPIECIDMAENKTDRLVQEWTENIKSKTFSLPLLFLNGRLRISGQFDIRQLLDVIEIEKEVGGF